MEKIFKEHNKLIKEASKQIIKDSIDLETTLTRGIVMMYIMELESDEQTTTIYIKRETTLYTKPLENTFICEKDEQESEVTLNDYLDFINRIKHEHRETAIPVKKSTRSSQKRVANKST
jgi:type IV secretory pathway ATPase VirB11/archaellum biosynthesis ATPase